MRKRQISPKRFSGIQRVDIINGKEQIKFKSTRSKIVSIEGRFNHRLGWSVWEDTLHLVSFEGEIQLPNDVQLSFKRGVDNVLGEVFATYAPSLPYGTFVEHRTEIASLEPYVDVPIDEVMKLTHKLTDTNSSAFFAPQSQLESITTLQLMERQNRVSAFRWNGPYNFLPKVQAGEMMLVPDVSSATTIEEIKLKSNTFLSRKMAISGSGFVALQREINRILLTRDGEKLYQLLMGLQDAMAATEAQVRSMRTTVQKRDDQEMREGLEQLRKKRVPYASTLAKNINPNSPFPVSQQLWKSIMAQVAALECAKTKGGASAPASTATTEAHCELRAASDWESCLEHRQAFCMCLHASGLLKLQLDFGGLSVKFKRVTTTDKLREWLPEVQAEETQTELGNLVLKKYRTTLVKFTPDADQNSYSVESTGKECNDELRGTSSSPPTPGSIAPPSPPDPEVKQGWVDYLKSSWNKMSWPF